MKYHRDNLMKIIISPAKKMNYSDSLPYGGLPCYIEKADIVRKYLKGLSYEEIKKVWKCNDSITALNIDRLRDMDLEKHLTSAVTAYDGIQYKYMAPEVLEEDALKYLDGHLVIISALYGALKPFDGIALYRLEMQAKACPDGAKDMYAFWKDDIYKAVTDSSNTILNLASAEYSKCIEPYLKDGDRFITCVFAEDVGGKLIQKGTLAKMARGEMVRYLAETCALEPEKAKDFNRLSFKFDDDRSDENNYIFVKSL